MRRLSLRRRMAFSAAALFLAIGVLEVVAGGVLRAVDFPQPHDDAPSWLVSQRSGIASGTYLADPHTLWRLKPGVQAPTQDRLLWGLGPMQANEHGHRGPSTARAKPDGVRRVLVLGGSHPMGMYVDQEAAYARVLERRLNGGDGPRWEVLNAAVAGHTTWQGLRYLERYGSAFEPDVVVFDLGMNDDLPLALDFAAPDHEVGAVPPWAGRLMQALEPSAAVFLLRQWIAPARRPPGDATRVPAERGEANLRAAAALGAQEGFEVLFMQQAALWEGEGGPGGGDRIECVREYVDFSPRVDVCALFAAFGGRAEAYFVDMIHANEAGHAVLADAIAATFVAEGWTR